MRSRSNKWDRIVREWGPVRRSYVEDHPTCPVTRQPSIECHEIAAGSHRATAFKERCAWLAVSREGHDAIQGRPYAEQLAYKLLQDPEGFDREWFCTEVLGRAGTAVTADEVLEELRTILIHQ